MSTLNSFIKDPVDAKKFKEYWGKVQQLDKDKQLTYNNLCRLLNFVTVQVRKEENISYKHKVHFTITPLGRIDQVRDEYPLEISWYSEDSPRLKTLDISFENFQEFHNTKQIGQKELPPFCDDEAVN